MKKIHAIFLFLFFFSTASAQKTSVWYSALAPIRKGSLEWHNDAGYRTFGFDATASQWLFRTGLRYYASPHFNFAGGYAIFATRVERGKTEFGMENRLWGEAVRQDRIKSLDLLQRIRLEQRFFNGTTEFNAFQAQRYRYRVAILKKISSHTDVQVYNEIMLQYQQSDLRYNQNRTGFFLHFKSKQRHQINWGYTYLNQNNNPLHLMMLGIQFTNQTTSGNR